MRKVKKKVKKLSEKKGFEELKGRFTHLEKTINDNHDDVAKMSNSRRSKRGIIMSTPPACRNKVNCAYDFKKSKRREEFLSKPTTSYLDLQKVGHILNGIYLIKHEDKINLVFCNFSSISSSTILGKKT